MLIQTLQSISQEFILAEQQILLSDVVQYTEQASQTFKGGGPGRIIASTYLAVEHGYGPPAALGFLICLQLLIRWAEENHDGYWIQSQYKAVERKGKSEVSKFVLPYFDSPASEMERIAHILSKKCLLRGFISYGNVKFGPNFQVGAYCLIGLLLFCEQTQSADEMTITE